jgi:hypothetical protein
VPTICDTLRIQLMVGMAHESLSLLLSALPAPLPTYKLQAQ